MSRPGWTSRWALIVAMLGGAAVFQAPGCNQIAAELTASWATSISDSLISSWLNQQFRVPSFNLGGFGT